MEDFNTSAYAQIVAKSWADPAFRDQLLRNPRSVLDASGISIPSGIQVTITEGTAPAKFELSLPPKPAGIDADTLKRMSEPNGCCCC